MSSVVRTFSQDATNDKLLRDMAQERNTNPGSIISQAVQFLAAVTDGVSRFPRDQRGRTVRIALLPEDHPDPTPPAVVLRLYLPVPAALDVEELDEPNVAEEAPQ